MRAPPSLGYGLSGCFCSHKATYRCYYSKVRSVLVAFRSTLLKTDLLAVLYFAVRVVVVYLPKKVHCKNNRDFNGKKKR